MKRKIWIIGLAVVILILAVGGTVVAAEAGQCGWLRGRVVDVADTSLTIHTKDSEMEVLITDETVFRVPGVSGATLADIQAGAFVLIRTKASEEGLPAARAVVVRTARRLQDNIVHGTVAVVGDGEVSVQAADGAMATLLITDTTRLWLPGEPPTTTVELAVGDPVLAFGQAVPTETGEKVLAARLVVVASDKDLPKVVIQGRAVAVTDQTIVVQTGRRERAITALPRTRIWSAEGWLDSLHSVHPGEQIIALGQPTELGQWIAGLVLLPGPEPLARHGLRGQVITIDTGAGTLTVQTEQRGQITVVTNDKTRYRIPGIEAPDLADIQVGDKIVALGSFDKENPTTFVAREIGVIALATEGGEI